MADFTAVIRRAVEGLPDNTPELRARVYEKARSAVVRQMENMNPRPPEALIKRQIDKIDAAIAEVEAEFAEALPEDAVVEEEPPFLAETISEPEAYEPERADEPVDEPAAPVEDEEPAPAPAWEEPEAVEPPEEDERYRHDDVDDEPESRYDAEEESDADYAPPSAVEPDYPYGQVSHVRYDGGDDEFDETPEAVEPDYSFDAPDEPLGGHSEVVIGDDEEEEPSRNSPEDWTFEAVTPAGGVFTPAPPPPRRPVPEKDWAHVDSLLGLEPDEAGGGFDEFEGEGEEAAREAVDAAEARRKRRIVAGAVGIVLVVLLAVGGYFGWANRNDLVALVSPADEPATVTQTATPPAPEPSSTETPQDTSEAPADTAAVEKTFTQRLLPDGNEVDEGLPAAGASTGPARSVASQTTASSEAPASGQNTTEPAPPVGAAQKMYLYEEQLGQSVPSAYTGTVEWELKQDNNGTDVPEPVIEGTMSVPDAGLSGTVTFRRNDDPSLPASHLVDIAFTLDDNFAGGAIDNVQRISMKSTEAARGDALIAVSAKITDDLYMLALNDFDQARSQNLALLGDRNWIDIPVTYRNGRRALLTLEKGTTGMAIFDRAIQEWQALGDIGDGGN